jgi:hypothetical protein
MPRLIKGIKFAEPKSVHGVLISVAAICKGLVNSGQIDLEHFEDILIMLSDIFGNVDDNWELMLQSDLNLYGVCALIESISSSNLRIAFFDNRKKIFGFLDAALDRADVKLQRAAAEALSALSKLVGLDDELFKNYVNGINPMAEKYQRCGIAQYFAILDFDVLQGRLPVVVDSLVLATVVQDSELNNFAECRRDAVMALVNIVHRLKDNLERHKELFGQVFNCLLECMNDFSIDSRGDVGSWIREASLVGFDLFIQIVSENFLNLGFLIDYEMCYQMTLKILGACLEKIDRTRAVGGQALKTLLKSELKFPRKLDLMKLPIDQLNWLVGREVYPEMVQCLEIEEYQKVVLVGFALSVGGLAESLVREASQSILNFLREKNISDTLCGHIMEMVQNGDDRVSVPLLETLDLFLVSGIVSNKVNLKSMFTIAKKQAFKCKNIRKLTACLKV